ncbi:MAG: alpha/beta hydrolase, partial [Muribaculaceae bacterium]|nr:alpha/beta hydrolase [Muribaculaceae bacterium]
MKKFISICMLLWICCFYVYAYEGISGSWHCKLQVTPQVAMSLVFKFDISADSKPVFSIDSPDQGVYNIPGEVVYMASDSVCVQVKNLGMSFSGALKEGKLSGKFRQGIMSRDIVLLPGSVERNRPQTPVPPFPYQTKDVTFANGDAVLAGTLTLPEAYDRKTPVVLMVTGSGLQNRDEEVFGHKPFAVIADFLARHGIATLRYDDRGYGASTGDPTNATTADFAADAAAGIKYLRTVAKFKNIGVLGHREGCTVAFMLAAGAKNSRPEFVVAMGAPSLRGDTILADQSVFELRRGNFPDSIVEKYRYALLQMYDAYNKGGRDDALEKVNVIRKGWSESPVEQSLIANINLIATKLNPWMEYFIKESPLPYISRTKCPAFILYGEKDMQVSPLLNEEPVRRAIPSARVKPYPGLNHIFQHAATGAGQE